MSTLENFDSNFVAEQYLEPLEERCRICGDSGEKERVMTLQDSPEVSLNRCSRCRVCSVSRVPKIEYIKELYNPERYTSSLMENSLLTTRLSKLISKQVKFSKSEKIKILDYGGNKGHLSLALREKLIKDGYAPENITATVIDFYQYENTDTIEYIHVDEMGSLKSDYNILLVSAVLEHLVEVGSILKSLLELTADGAVVYGRTPYEAPLNKIYKGYKIRWPRHLHDMGPEFWENILSIYGVKGEVVGSQPSIVETTLSQKPLFTIFAYLLKMPSLLECKVIKPLLGYKGYIWRVVGGWQAFLRIEKKT